MDIFYSNTTHDSIITFIQLQILFTAMVICSSLKGPCDEQIMKNIFLINMLR